WYTVENGGIKASDIQTAPIQLVLNPNAEEVAKLCKTYNLDEHSINSALDPDEVSRVEYDAESLSIIFKRPKSYSANDMFLFRIASMGMFLFNGTLLIILSENIPLFDNKLFLKVTSLKEVLLKMLFLCISHFIGHLKVINKISDELEEKVNTSMENKHLINMFSLEKSLVYYLNAIQSNMASIEKMKHYGAKIGFDESQMDFLDDMLIENQQCFKQAEIYSNVLTGLMDARGSIVNNNLNILIKRLTLINVVFMPLNLLASIGGMSEFSMMTKNYPWPIAYSLFLLGMGIIGLLFYFIMRNMSKGNASLPKIPKL
ncbi:MAG: magnesium transporter CorA family protein, partial [Chitinivibrionales bacterium]|nr:magnesium transporter CorA family protein [Chitinivibrionales bacterium]